MKTGRTVRDVAVPGCGGGGEPGGDGGDVPVDEPQPLGQQRAAAELLPHEPLHHQRLADSHYQQSITFILTSM